MNCTKISVIIMTLNAEQYISKLIEDLLNQSVKPDEILVIDSDSNDDTVKIAAECCIVKIIKIKKSEFDHGGSRHLGVINSNGDYILFLTQDAVIGNERYIENLIKNFSDKNVAMVCGRQIAKSDAYPYEKYVREFNYPSKRIVRTKSDIKHLGIKTFFMSDVCSAYRRSAYKEIGGFDSPLLTNEDMLIASKAIMNGYQTVYEPTAYVFHSHNFTLSQEFKRNFDIAAFMVMHNDTFKGLNITGEGVSMVKYVSFSLLKQFKLISFIRFIFICFAKFLGNRKGKKVLDMSLNEILKYTSNKSYWLNNYGTKR